MEKYDRFKDPRHIKWAKRVKERDGFRCQICEKEGTYLNSHHIKPYHIFVDDRFDVENGACLCIGCHKQFHAIYGASINNEFQFEEYKKITKLMKSIILENVNVKKDPDI